MIDDYENVAEQLEQMEFLSVAGFFRRLPVRFHMDEINRFGRAVGNCAESNHLAYVTQFDRTLGPVRVFPVPLMTRVYQVLSAHQGWPPIVEDVPALTEKPQESAARVNEKAKKVLQAATEKVENPVIASAITTVLNWLDSETDRLRSEPEVTPPASPLRSI